MEHLDDELVSYPLTPSQQSFWALSEIYPESNVGNEALCLRLRGPLQREALLASIAELARRNDTWRTTIELDRDDPTSPPLARVRAFEPFPIESVDLSGLSAAEGERELAAGVWGRVRERFDLANGPLVRVTLFRCARERHALLFVSHHVAFDASSLFELLPRSLARLYGTFLRGAPPDAPRPARFAEFARTQHQLCEGPAGPDLEFWRETLAGASGAIELPVDRRRHGPRTGRGLRAPLALGAELRERLASRARELGVSLSDLLLAAYAALLHRYSALTELLIGVPNGNRREARYALMFGLAMLTLPVRVDVRSDASFRDVALRVRSSKRSAFEHLDPRVDEVLREQVVAEGEPGPGYHVVFNYAPPSAEPIDFPGLEVELERPDPGWTAVDLSLDVLDSGAELALTLEIDRDVFDDASAGRMLGHYLRLLEAIAGGAEGPISRLPLLSDSERREQAAAALGPTLDYRRTTCLHTIVAEHLAREPHALAAVCGDRTLSRHELQRDARRLGLQLRALGAQPGECVALLLDDPLAALAAMLGALESGAAFVPIDPASPQARITWMLESCRPVAVVTQRALAAAVPRDRPVLCCDALPADLPEIRAPGREPSAEDPAYLIFTSGSTGRPKGVVVRHRNVVSQLFARMHGYPERPERLLTSHSFAFDAAYAGVFWALAEEAALVLPDADERRDPMALRKLVAAHAVTHLDLPPVLHQELLADDCGADLRSLSTVIVGGEACSSALAGRHARLLPHAQLYNEYGPTETTIYSTVYAVPRDSIPDPVPIGRPIANTRCYVLDAELEPLPRGVPGELYIGGDGVAAGYLDDPQLTARHFLADPFASNPGARMYRTGDRARLRSDGELEFLGRVDRQIKLRGNRVELSEIEAALQRCPGVSAAVAMAREQDGGAQIDAWVVLAPTQTPAGVRALLRAELPDYMVPTRIAALASLPLSSAGKVDLERLRALPPAAETAPPAEGVQGFIEPRTQAEQQITAIWAGLLGVQRISVHDDFFALGGHSLLAVRMLGLVARTLGGRVALAAFARTPSVASLASLLHEKGGAPEEPLVVPIQPIGNRPPFWLIHPVGGHVVFAKRLAVHLDPGQPLFGIQAQGLDGHREPLATIEAMADHYAALIARTQPSGPYLVGGYSMGGSIALEIARRLRDAGRTLGLVALLDAPGPDYPRRLSLLGRALDRARFLMKGGWRERAHAAAEYFSYPAVQAPEAASPIPDAIERVTHVNALAAELYRPQPYTGRIHVFRALRTPDWPGLRFDDPLCGWGPYARDVVVVQIDCFHTNMMDEPAVTELGKKLSAVLDDAQRRRLPA